MRAIFTLFAAFAMCIAAGAQTVVRSEVIATGDLGNVKLVEAGGEFMLKLRTGNEFQSHITVSLGDKDRAVNLLQFLYDTELDAGDVIDLENESGNIAKWEALSEINGYRILSSGGRLGGWLRKPLIKKYIGIIKNY